MVGFSSAAQTQEKRDLLDRIEEMEIGPGKVLKHASREYKIVDFSLLGNLGYGHTHVSSPSFSSSFSRSWEFFLNIVNLSINPTKWLSLDVGGDLKYDSFWSSGYKYFTLDDDRYPQIASLSETDADAINNIISRLSVLSISLPVTLGLNFSGINLRGGAEFFWPIQGKSAFTQTRVQTNDGWTTSRQWKAKTEKFSMNYMAAISWEGLGLYFKYYPKPLVPSSSNATFNYWTIGIVSGF